MSDTVDPKPRTRRSVMVLLFVSLALNLLVAGLVVGAVVGHRLDRENHPPRLDRAGGPMTAALSFADRRAIGKALRQASRESRPSRAEIRAEYRVVITALTKVPYDPEAVRAAVDRQMKALNARAELGKDLLLTRLEQMSDAERAAFAKRLEDVLERGPAQRPKGRRGSVLAHPWR